MNSKLDTNYYENLYLRTLENIFKIFLLLHLLLIQGASKPAMGIINNQLSSKTGAIDF